MKKFTQLFLAASLAVVIAVSVNADEKKADKKGKGKGRKAPSVTARLVSGLDLTAEQKTAIAGIDKEFAAKAGELRKKESSIVSKEQLKKAQEAMKAAKEAGKKGKELFEARSAALGLSEEQKAQYTELQKARRELQGGVIAALKKVLTPEQAAKLPGGKRKKPAKKDGDKKKKKDADK